MPVSFPAFASAVDTYENELPKLLSKNAVTLDGGLDEQGEYAQLVCAYTKRKHVGLLSKMRYLKACVAAFGKEFPLPLKKLRFPFTFRQEIYMTDSGELTLSWGVAQKHGFYRLHALLLHELAHLLLSAHKDYPLLLALDKVFLSRHAENAAATTLSPVELYATQISVALLDATAQLLGEGEKEQMLAQATQETEKLSAAYALFENATKKL